VSNSSLFKKDEAIQKWLMILEENVYFEPGDYGMKCAMVEEEQKQAEPRVEKVKHCKEKNFNPFHEAKEIDVHTPLEQKLVGYKTSF